MRQTSSMLLIAYDELMLGFSCLLLSVHLIGSALVIGWIDARESSKTDS